MIFSSFCVINDKVTSLYISAQAVIKFRTSGNETVNFNAANTRSPPFDTQWARTTYAPIL
jgi:hypothetical protein